MGEINPKELDRWITGNWGEDQVQPDPKPDECETHGGQDIQCEQISGGYRYTCRICGDHWIDEFPPDSLVEIIPRDEP